MAAIPGLGYTLLKTSNINPVGYNYSTSNPTKTATAIVGRIPTSSNPTGGSGSTVSQTYAPVAIESGGGYEPYTLPEYGYSVNLNVPDFTWNPTEAQRAGWANYGATRANTVIDPQVAAVLQALSRFKTEATNQQNEINPRYTNMSLALANVIKNSVLQPGIDTLIRRGAADSGALQQLAEQAGRYETEQRAAVESERNQILNALANQVLAKEQETTDAQTALEKLRGQYTDVYTGEEEQKAMNQFNLEKQSRFNADLAVAQLQNQVAAAIAQQQYQQALLNYQQQQSAFENALAEKQFGLQQALQNYQISRANSASSPTKDTTIWVDTPYGKMTYAQAYQYGFAPGGQYNQQQNTTQAFLDWLNK